MEYIDLWAFVIQRLPTPKTYRPPVATIRNEIATVLLDPIAAVCRPATTGYIAALLWVLGLEHERCEDVAQELVEANQRVFGDGL